MAKHEDLPFPIGTTYFDGQTADLTTVTATNLEGKEYEVEDLFYANGSTGTMVLAPTPSLSFQATKQLRTAWLKKVRIMRNVASCVLSGGYLCQPLQASSITYVPSTFDGRFYLGRTPGYSSVGGSIPATSVPAYGIDEFLGYTGVPNNDLFYATVEGPFLGVMSANTADLSGTTGATVTGVQIGDVLVAATAAASTLANSTNTTQIQTATCGRLAELTISAASSSTSAPNVINAVIARLGRALSSLATSASTNQPLLMYFTRN